MIERRLVGRRYVDFHPESAAPFFPDELERRLGERRSGKRRCGDRAGAPDGLEALYPGRRRLPPVLWSGILRCSGCGAELLRAHNLSREARKYFIVEHVYNAATHGATRKSCACERDRAQKIRAQIEWIMQAGTA